MATFKNLSPTQPDTVTIGTITSTPPAPFPIEAIHKLVWSQTESVVTALEVIAERLERLDEGLRELTITAPPVYVDVHVPEQPAPTVQVHIPELPYPTIEVDVPPQPMPRVSVAAHPGEVALGASLVLPRWLWLGVLLVVFAQLACAGLLAGSVFNLF